MSDGGILTGPEIISAVHREDIHITPFEPGLVNPASVDLRLGKYVTTYTAWVSVERAHECAPLAWYQFENFIIDVKEKPETETHEIPEAGFVLKPGILYLMHTVESISTTKYVPVLDGKSSIGRLGIQVHITAGFGDPGFDGQYTLEVTAMHPVRIYPGMRFCQMRFHTTVGAFMDYQGAGHYKGKAARGAVGSAVHKQFEEGK